MVIILDYFQRIKNDRNLEVNLPNSNKRSHMHRHILTDIYIIFITTIHQYHKFKQLSIVLIRTKKYVLKGIVYINALGVLCIKYDNHLPLLIYANAKNKTVINFLFFCV